MLGNGYLESSVVVNVVGGDIAFLAQYGYDSLHNFPDVHHCDMNLCK